MIKLIALSAAVFVLIFISIFSPLFEIKEIIFTDDQNCLEDSNQIAEDQLIGSNIIFFDPTVLIGNLKENYPCIDQVAIDKKYPTKLVVEIKSKVQAVNIEDSTFQATRDGLIVNANDRLDLPTLFLPKDLEVELGKKIENDVILSAIEIAASLEKSDFIPATIRIVDDEDIAVYNSKDILVIFSSNKSVEEQVDSLQLILGKAKIDAEKIATVNLRFDKPVITYE